MPTPSPEERHHALAKVSKILESKNVLQPLQGTPEQALLDRLQAKVLAVAAIHRPVVIAVGFVNDTNLRIPIAKDLLNQLSEFTYDELLVLQALFATNVVLDRLRGTSL